MIFCNGFPKHGNHALVKAVQLLGLPATVSHTPYADGFPEGTRCSIFIKRDPRDAIVSWLRWNRKPVSPGMFLTAFRKFQDRPLVQEMRDYEGWLTHDATLVVKYEDLIASDAALRRIAEYAGTAYIDGAWELLPGITVTWNDVRSDYRKVWTPHVQDAWQAEGGNDLLTRWGY